jgi:hypothetical protein
MLDFDLEINLIPITRGARTACIAGSQTHASENGRIKERLRRHQGSPPDTGNMNGNDF